MSSASTAGQNLSSLPPLNWPADSRGHSVQFYSEDAILLDGLSRFIGSALGAGDAAIVIATKSHRNGLSERVKSRGVDVALAARQGRYMSFDAAETLSKFMVNDWPDETRFAHVIGSLIQQAKAACGHDDARIAAFGEMVALLWADGKPEAAIRLEQLWNDLGRAHAFYLHCAYPMCLFRQAGDGEPIVKICAEHSHVVPHESYTSLITEEARLRSIIFLQQKAQALETEIQERRKVQQELQHRESELSDFLENAIVAMHWVAADGTIVWANKAEMNLLGYRREDYIGHHIAEFYVDPSVIDDILCRLMREEELHGYQARLKCKDGSVRHVRIHSNVLRKDGEFIHTRCFTFDVTNQVKGDEARAKLAAIVESSDDAIASKDVHGIVNSWNAAAERIFGWKAEEIIGRPMMTIIPPELQEQEEMILAKIRRGERIDHFETERITKSGERIDVSLTISPIKDERGTVVGAAKIARDITESKKLVHALHVTERLASVGRLAATVAHEINNPLEAISNLLYLAKRDLKDLAKAKSHLDLADHELNRVAHIAKQTLGFYRDTSSPKVMNIAETLDDLLILYSKKLEVRRIELRREYGKNPEICALPGEIRQVISNLLSNAIDAMPNSGRLAIRAARSRDWRNSNLPGVRITVADTGCGIDAQSIKRLFEPFYTTKKDVGVGLGLWITNGIVKKHGGSIKVRSRIGGHKPGTVFSIFLPQTLRPPDNESEWGDAQSPASERLSMPRAS